MTVEFSVIQAVYITGKEVFSFKMISYMDATAGSTYTDMNVVDMQVNLTVGCIEVVFVTKFLYSILAFIDNFQAVKQALAEATVQAAGMAATGVKELAQRTSISWPGKAGDTYWSEAWLLCTALGRPCEGIVTVTSRSGGRRLAAPHAARTAPTSATALGLRVITCVVLLVLGNLGLGQ